MSQNDDSDGSDEYERAVEGVVDGNEVSRNQKKVTAGDSDADRMDIDSPDEVDEAPRERIHPPPEHPDGQQQPNSVEVVDILDDDTENEEEPTDDAPQPMEIDDEPRVSDVMPPPRVRPSAEDFERLEKG